MRPRFRVRAGPASAADRSDEGGHFDGQRQQGHPGRQPRSRRRGALHAGGAAVATLNLATTETWNDKEGQRQEKTEWHRVVLWGKQAESAAAVPREGQADLRRGPPADAAVGRQGRQQALHDRDQGRPHHAARQRRRWWRAWRERGADYGQGEPMREPVDVPEDDIPF